MYDRPFVSRAAARFLALVRSPRTWVFSLGLCLLVPGVAQAVCVDSDFSVPNAHTSPSTSPMASGGTLVIDASFCNPSGLNDGGGATPHGSFSVDTLLAKVTYVNDGHGDSATDTFTFQDDLGNDIHVTVAVGAASTIVVSPSSLPSPATFGVFYSQTLSATGGTAPYTFVLDSGTLPGGLSFSGDTLSGTPNQAGTFNFGVTVTDNTGASTPKSYSLTVGNPTIVVDQPPSAVINVPYSHALSASGGTSPYTYAVHSGSSLPPGLALNNGVISGTPTALGSYSFQIEGRDSSASPGPYTSITTLMMDVTNQPPTAGPASATVAYGSTNNPITLNLSGPAATSVAVGTQAAHGTATAVGTTISYTPTTGYAGPDSFTYTASNAAGSSSPATVTVTVSPPTIVYTPSSPPHAQAGMAYSQSIAGASGGAAPYSYAKSAGSLPAGLSLAANGVISGIPTAAGSFTIQVRATDSSTGTGPFTSAPANVTVIADAPAIAIAPAALTDGTVNTPYSQTITASGGTAAYTYTVDSGTLPNGLTLSTAGVLSGTPTQAGSFPISIRANDSTTGPAAPYHNSQAYTLTIAPPTIALAPASLPNATVGTSYSQSLSASGGTAPYTFATTAGTVPTGMNLAPDGTLSGTPTTAGDFGFTVQATDAQAFPGTGNYTVHVSAIAPGKPTGATATAGDGQATVTFVAPTDTGGATIGDYTVTSSPGLKTATGNGSPIVVTGLTNGTAYTFTVVARNVAGPGPASDPSNAITPQGTQTITFNNPGTQAFGTSPTVTASATSTLPVTFTSTGVCSITSGGTLTFSASGTCDVTAHQTGDTAYLPAAPVTQSFQVAAIAPGAPVIGTATTSASGEATVSFTAPANDGGANVSSYVATSSPGGFTGSGPNSPITVSGLTNGTAYTFTVQAINSTGPGAVSGSSNSVTPQGRQTITFGNPGTQQFGTQPQLTATSDSGLPVSFSSTTTSICTVSTTGLLTLLAPGQCSINADQSGDTAFLPASTVTRQFAVAVPGGAVAFSVGPAMPTATAETAYSFTITAAGGAAPYIFDLPSGGLPNGLSLNPSSGAVTGTPLVAGNFTIPVRVTDAATQTATQSFQLTIDGPSVTITPPTVPDGTVGKAYSQTLSTAGGVAPYTYAATGALPNGMALSPAGTLSGTPTEAGSFAFTATATDQHGFQAVQNYTLVVGQPAPVTVNDTSNVAANGSVSIPVTNGDSGPITSLAITQQPAHGSATVNGLNIVYTPAHDYFGTDTLKYTASGPGGTSAPATVTITVAAGAVPVAKAQAATVLAGKPVTIHAAAGAVNGPITAVALVGKPASGTAVVQGTDIIYTADANASGKVEFDFTLSNAFGLSQPAHVTVTVNARPVAPNLAASAIAGTTVQVDLTATAHGGPFMAAKVLSISPADAGTATVTAVAEGGYTMSFTAAPTFGGMAQVSYTLTNAFATSDPGTVSVSVTPRSDPSKNAEVLGVLDAQVDATRRMATGQIGNFQRRLESLHGGGSVGGFSNGITMASASGMRRSGTMAGMRDSMDERNDRYLVAPDAAPAPAASPSTGTGGARGDIAFWTGGAVNFGKMQTGTSDNGIDFTTSGLSFGADKQVTSQFTLGMGVGYGHDKSDIGQHGSRSSVDSYNVALYGSYQPTRTTYVDAVVGYQWLQFDARRYVTDNGNTVHGDRDGKQVFASLSVGYQHQTDDMRLTPYGRLDIARASLDGYTEKGDAIYSLDYRGQTVKTSTATLGVLAQWSAKRDYGVWAPQLRAEFGHDMQGSSQATMRYADLLNGPLYRATLTRQSRTHTMLGAGLALQTLKGWLLRVEYQNYLDNTSTDNQSILLGVEKKFDP
ncbi:putative Ig domain-containing protein [Luteibacter yeojuensis]|uniref:Autotransporter domain-containing protein n=1 Tax=Luteibacter yeojuensis TaxID=345309 RepID=A0A7X5QW10_9GAMM|nr:putative Ig domain-containing protein [Luteibacter yeojuensis]NID16463.1 autotransporter domain-containing protein [Luteibacter yeojuensis]